MKSHRPLPPRRRRSPMRSPERKISHQASSAHFPSTAAQPVRRSRQPAPLRTAVPAGLAPGAPVGRTVARKKIRKSKRSPRWAMMLQKVVAVSSLGIGTGLILMLPLLTRPDPRIALSGGGALHHLRPKLPK